MEGTVVGRVLGTSDATPLQFWVAVSPGAYLQLDDVVVTSRELPDGSTVAFAGVVTGRGPRAVLRAALDRTGAPAGRVVHVGTDRAELRAAAALGMRVAHPADLAEAVRPLAAAS